MSNTKSLNINSYKAAIFDLDGVITRTAEIHEKAWKQIFNSFLKKHSQKSNKSFHPLEHEDYLRFIDGKPRYEGVQSFLKSRGIELPEGNPDDKPGNETVFSLGNEKDRVFHKLLKKEGVKTFKDSINTIKKWKNKGLKVGIISSSKNCKEILKRARIEKLFDIRVDGIISEKKNLKGKPKPDIFLEAASGLEVEPENTMIFEDSIAGVEAGRSGKFGLVVGVSHNGQTRKLKSSGADVVINNFIDFSEKIEELGKEPDMIPSAIEHLPEINRLLADKLPVLFFDFDGTLAPIVDQPTDARMDEEMKNILLEISTRCKVAVISGRDLEDVKNRISIDQIYYAGSHGFEITGPGNLAFSPEHSDEYRKKLRDVNNRLRDEFNDTSGLIVETKKFATAIHYRNANHVNVNSILSRIEKIVNKTEGLRIDKGKKVFEVKPDIDWDKGKAIFYLLNILRLNSSEITPIYLGDDITDEDVFIAFEEHEKGIGILVGDHGEKSQALYHLDDTNEVKQFLIRFNEVLKNAFINEWEIIYKNFDPSQQPLRESLCALGNGYFVTRGAFEEEVAHGSHYPGTYLAGGYNRLESKIKNEVIENEDLVNWPNWLGLSFRPKNGQWLHLENTELLYHQQKLNIREGYLSRQFRIRDKKGRITSISAKRIVSMHDRHMAGIEWKIIPENWSGNIQIRSCIDGSVENSGVERYRDLRGDHLNILNTGYIKKEKKAFIHAETKQSRLRMAIASTTQITIKNKPVKGSHKVKADKQQINETFAFKIEKEKEIRIEKLVSIFTSQDFAISEELLEAKKRLDQVITFNELCQPHYNAWNRLWRRCDIQIEGDKRTQQILHFHIFHLLQTVSHNTIDQDAGVPSRGWHGEAYRGHIFWDELFIFPFLNLRLPEISRELLMYRYRRLHEARLNAKNAGFKGAMYPWQSGSNGREESQHIHLNPESGNWIPDNTYLQRHINAAIAYNIWQYYQATIDMEFLTFYGAEMILEIAKFWESIALYNYSRRKYEIRKVAGPDEYHTQYPGSEHPGIDNNAYTNIMAAWTLWKALEVLNILDEERKLELEKELSINEKNYEKWDKISRNLFIPAMENGLISQFEGYEKLEELDWEKYRSQYGETMRLDRILEDEGDFTNKYKASKQADVLMLFYLFSAEELKDILDRLNFEFDTASIPEHIKYYEERTSHGSTLSRFVHSWVIARSDRERSWHNFEQALMSDIKDVQGGTTPEGIHLGAMAGTVDLIQRCYTGIETRDNILWLNPALPQNITCLKFRVRYRGHWIRIRISENLLKIQFDQGWSDHIKIGVKGELHEFKRGESKVFDLTKH